jgi:hypothetical protein
MDDKASLITTIKEYFRVLYESDADAGARLFHPDCTLFNPENGSVHSVSLAGYLDVVRNRHSPKMKGESPYGEIITIDQTGPATAFVKVLSAVQPRYFVDYLTLVADTSGWRIVAKVYREMPAPHTSH